MWFLRVLYYRVLFSLSFLKDFEEPTMIIEVSKSKSGNQNIVCLVNLTASKADIQRIDTDFDDLRDYCRKSLKEAIEKIEQ